MRLLISITYDGTNFYGYQVQPGKRTVQRELEYCLKKTTGCDIKTVASGRTDSGVHARGQKVSFDYDGKIPYKKFPEMLNTELPDDLKVLDVKTVDDNFSARFSAKRKTYEYKVYLSKITKPLKERYSLKISREVDVDKIIKASKLFIGEKDFKCCLASGSSVKDTIRTIYSLDIVKNEEDISFFVTGNGFLYNMVRIIVGTLLEVGYGTKTIDDIQKGLDTGDRKCMGKTVSAKGLCLYSVEY